MNSDSLRLEKSVNFLFPSSEDKNIVMYRVMTFKLIEAATMTPRNAVHGRLPGSGYLPRILWDIVILPASPIIIIMTMIGYAWHTAVTVESEIDIQLIMTG